MDLAWDIQRWPPENANDFTAEWRWNVLRGYASRSISVPATHLGRQTLRIYLLDPGIVLQEIIIK